MLRTLHHHDGTTQQIHLGGWKRQSHDHRDEEFRIKLHPAMTGAPTAYDNRQVCSAVEDQDAIGSCTANMTAGLIEENEVRGAYGSGAVGLAMAQAMELRAALASVGVTNIQTDAKGVTSFTLTVTPPASPPPPPPPAPTPDPTPAPTPTPPTPKLIQVSRLFEYYMTRVIEGTTGEDSGASIRDAIKAAAKYGVLDESIWPYDISKFTVKPTTAMLAEAAKHKITSYHSIADGDLATMKSVLASGQLIGFGFKVYAYMMSAAMAKLAELPKPDTTKEAYQGGHAVCLVGYDDTKRIKRSDGTYSTGAFIVRNSWGEKWGMSGYFWMAYDYVADTTLASDFWVVVSTPVMS